MAHKNKSKNQTSRKLQTQLDEYFGACVKAFGFSGSMLVSHKGKPIWSDHGGFANAEHRVPNAAHTKYRIASITKPFTAVAIMMLQEKGKLKISDPIANHLKDSPKHWKKITIHHLLTHTSGIPSYTDFPDHQETKKHSATPSELVSRFRDKPLQFNPGEKYAYCNSGYVLLGVLIETISGKDYAHFLEERIFKPLGMKNTGLDNNEVVLANRAQGYSLDGDNNLRNSSYIDMSVPYAAGGMYSTADDLARFDRALAQGKLLSKASIKEMLKPERDNYACGWAVYKVGERTIEAHAGGINGFATNFERIPSENYCSVILSNIEGAPIHLIAQNLRSIFVGEPYTVPKHFKEIKMDPSDFRKYEGQYEFNPDFMIHVFREGNHLMAQATGQSKLRLVPYSHNKFFYPQVYAQITFGNGKDKTVSSLTLHQNGFDQQAKKVKATRKTKP